MDQSRGSQDGLYRTWITLGERILRKLQRENARRVAERRNLLLAPRSPNHHRKMEEPLQYQATTQCIGLPPARARGHRSDGPKANHALTFKLDHSSGAAQDDEIITSREATLQHIGDANWGVICADSDALINLPASVMRLGNRAEDYDAVDKFLFLSTANWTAQNQELLVASMKRNSRPLLIGNADLAAPRDDGFSFEPGHFGHLIADLFPDQVQFFGKPFPEVYDLIESSLPGVQQERIAMCGDTLHTDILGAAARGWRTVLVTQDGLFAGHDAKVFSEQSGLFADWRLARI